MTEEDIRKKAEAWADEQASEAVPKLRGTTITGEDFYLHVFDELRYAYLQCWKDLQAEEPDGWCAWHPEKGLSKRSFSTHSELHSWYLRLGIDEDSEYSAFKLYEHPAILAAIGLGWRIVPVKLVALEEK